MKKIHVDVPRLRENPQSPIVRTIHEDEQVSHCDMVLINGPSTLAKHDEALDTGSTIWTETSSRISEIVF